MIIEEVNLKEEPDDIILVERLQRGDVDAFDLLYYKYSSKLYAFGLKYLRSENDAEGLVQTVFLKLWENHKKLKKELSFKSFVFTIAYNNICTIIRDRKYNKRLIDHILNENSESSSFISIEKSIEYRSVLDCIEHIINKLPDNQKNIFFKSRKEGKSTKEIADETGLSPKTIDNYISKSIKFIRKYVKKENLFETS